MERKIFNHELVYLNPNYKDEETPPNYRDWLDLIYESIHSPENPKINTENAGIKRVSEIIQYENISPEEWENAKIEASKRKVIKLEREEGRDEEKNEIAIKMIAANVADIFIEQMTGLTLKQIQELRNDISK